MNIITDKELQKITEMTIEERNEVLKELRETKFWIALGKYSLDRVDNVKNAIIPIDPVKEPTKISRFQGMIDGIVDSLMAINSLTTPQEDKDAKDPTVGPASS